MNLLLTSAGITNQSISNSLRKLANNPNPKIALIPTAANVEPGDKTSWFFSQFDDLKKHGFTWIDMVDISAKHVDWRKRLSAAEVIFMSGGNTFHLLECVREFGFDEWLKVNLESKVYVGASAGSIIVTPTIAIAGVEPGDDNQRDLKDLRGLNLVDFEISPHTPEMLSYEANEEYSKSIKNVLYALDNQSAIEVIDGKHQVISEGKWKSFNV